MLAKHAEFFGGSQAGKGLLSAILVEVTAGRMTVDHMLTVGDSTDPNNYLVKQLISAGISKSTKEVLDEPGKCAGSMVG